MIEAKGPIIFMRDKRVLVFESQAELDEWRGRDRQNVMDQMRIFSHPNELPEWVYHAEHVFENLTTAVDFLKQSVPKVAMGEEVVLDKWTQNGHEAMITRGKGGLLGYIDGAVVFCPGGAANTPDVLRQAIVEHIDADYKTRKAKAKANRK